MATQKSKKTNDPTTVLSGAFVVVFEPGGVDEFLSMDGGLIPFDVSISRGRDLDVVVTELVSAGCRPEDMLVVYPDARRIVTKVSAEFVDRDSQSE